MKVRLSGSPFLPVTPERFRRIQQRWSELRANRQGGLEEYMVNNVIRDIRVYATRAGCNLDGMLTTHAFRKS